MINKAIMERPPIEQFLEIAKKRTPGEWGIRRGGTGDLEGDKKK